MVLWLATLSFHTVWETQIQSKCKCWSYLLSLLPAQHILNPESLRFKSLCWNDLNKVFSEAVTLCLKCQKVRWGETIIGAGCILKEIGPRPGFHCLSVLAIHQHCQFCKNQPAAALTPLKMVRSVNYLQDDCHRGFVATIRRLKRSFYKNHICS